MSVSKKSSPSKTRYFKMKKGQGTSRTGYRKLHRAPKGNFDGVITFDQLPPITVDYEGTGSTYKHRGNTVRRGWAVDNGFRPRGVVNEH